MKSKLEVMFKRDLDHYGAKFKFQVFYFAN